MTTTTTTTTKEISLVSKLQNVDYIALGDKTLTVVLSGIAWVIVLSRRTGKSLAHLRPILVSTLRALLALLEEPAEPAPETPVPPAAATLQAVSEPLEPSSEGRKTRVSRKQKVR